MPVLCTRYNLRFVINESDFLSTKSDIVIFVCSYVLCPLDDMHGVISFLLDKY
jgi:hypothetical protein